MIEPEHVLYVIEGLAIQHDGDECGSWSLKQLQDVVNKIYRLSHAGTSAMHKCQHADWEAEVIETEKQLVEAGVMSPYDVAKARAMGLQLEEREDSEGDVGLYPVEEE